MTPTLTRGAPDAGAADTDPDGGGGRSGFVPPSAGWSPPPPPSPAGRRGTSLPLVVALLVAALAAGALLGLPHLRPQLTDVPRTLTWPTPSTPSRGDANGSRPGGDATAIGNAVSPAVVEIVSAMSGGRATGTGMVLTPSGEVLTNNHVIQGATDIRALVDGGRRSYTAKVLGYDVADDVALLQLQGASGLETVRTGGSQGVRVGDAVVAVGYAGGQPGAPTVTDGSVTALGRTLTAADPGGRAETLSGMIQIDAQIEPGDSGGPLLDGDGKVIGINTAAAAGYRMAASDVGFAVPIDTALTIVRQVEAGKGSAKVHVGPRGILGVEVQPADRVPGRLGRGFAGGASTANGAVVVGVASGGPADRGGLAPGGTIVSIDGTSIATADDLTAALGSHHPGDKVAVGWTDQSGAHHTATLILIAGPPD